MYIYIYICNNTTNNNDHNIGNNNHDLLLLLLLIIIIIIPRESSLTALGKFPRTNQIRTRATFEA